MNYFLPILDIALSCIFTD